MWSHAHVNLIFVWEECYWTARLIWVEDGSEEPIILEKGGRVPLGTDGSPSEALAKISRRLYTAPPPATG